MHHSFRINLRTTLCGFTLFIALLLIPLAQGFGRSVEVNTINNGTNGSVNSAQLYSMDSGFLVSIYMSTDVTCNGVNDGSADASVSGGCGGLITFTWDDGPTGSSRSDLPPGTYWVTASDTYGNSDRTSVTITEPPVYSFYADSDYDGYGSGDLQAVCATDANTPPSGWSLNNTDCDDTDNTIHEQFSFYADNDGDGYGTGDLQPVCAVDALTPPAGYSTDNTDCDDTDGAIHEQFSFYLDSDGDGYGTGDLQPVCAVDADTPPAGYSTVNTDCDDTDGTIHEQFSFYLDSDGDGYGTGDLQPVCAVDADTPPAGYSTNHTDCDDTDGTIHEQFSFYLDSDNDGFGDINAAPESLCAVDALTPPAGYSADNTDCDDTDGSVHEQFSFYADNDNDGYGDINASPESLCAVDADTPPAGYSTDNTDCDDTDGTIHEQFSFYLDSDGDGYGTGDLQPVCAVDALTAPAGYSTDNTDCNDTDGTIHEQFNFYIDSDNDGYGTGGYLYPVCAVDADTPPTGYSTNNTDCNDADDTIHEQFNFYLDSDGDGFGDINAAPESLCTTDASTPPAGYSTNNTDCDDTDNTIHEQYSFYADNDGDGFGDINASFELVCAIDAATPPAGYSTNNTDCDDTDNTIHEQYSFYADNDGDGFGDINASFELVCAIDAATPPAGYSTNNTDCDDTDNTIHEQYSFYADNDGDGFGDINVTFELVCAIDAATPPTGYSTNNTDCDDTDGSIHGQFNFYADNDGDGYGSGSLQPVCALDANTPPPGYSANNSDCDDVDGSIHGQFSFYVDSDGDGHGTGYGESVCAADPTIAPPGYSIDNTDCNDTDPAIWLRSDPPAGESAQSFCASGNPTVGNISVTGDNILWYDALTDGNIVLATTPLTDGTTIYASQTTAGTCESSRTAVAITINSAPDAPTATATQSFCSTGSPTVADLVTLTGTGIKWYSLEIGGTLYSSTDALANATDYWASQTATGCESSARVKVTATVNSASCPIVTPTTQASNIVFSPVHATQFTASWTNGNGSDRIVFVQQVVPVPTVTFNPQPPPPPVKPPVDGTTYTVNPVFSGGSVYGSGWHCVYKGTGTTVTVTGLNAATDYLLQVFEYNGGSGSEKYNTSTASDNPKSQTTLSSDCLPTIEVQNTNDAGVGSLRQAILDLCVDGTITFNSSLSGQTISLSSAELLIEKGMTIDGSALAIPVTISGNSALRVFNVNAPSASVTLQGLTVTDGYTTSDGAGIYVVDADPFLLTNVTVSNSHAGTGGGGLYKLTSGTSTFTGVTFTGNSALWGAAIYLQEGASTITGSTINLNTAVGTGAAAGGIYERNGTLSVINSVITENTAEAWGGAIYLEHPPLFGGSLGSPLPSLNLSGSTISANIVNDGRGGGIYIDNGTVNMENSTKICYNQVKHVTQYGDGGGIYLVHGTLTSTGSAIRSNSADNSGGGVYLFDTDAIYNSTNDSIATNTAVSYGGGVAVYNGNINLGTAIVKKNISNHKGGGIYLWAPTGTITIDGSTFIENETKNGLTVDVNYGGALFMDNAQVDITNSTFTGNKATRSDSNGPKGGAIYLYQGTLDISGGTFDSNQTNTTQGKGGAIFNDLGALTSHSGTSFTSNSAGRSGGAIFANQAAASTTSNNTTFTSNSAVRLGGAIYLSAGTMNNDGCVFSLNTTLSTTVEAGGAINHNNGTSTTRNSTFHNNSSYSGGGFYFKDGTATVVNSLFYDNTASARGGAIFTELSTANLTLTNSTLTGNSATTSGGGLFNLASTAITVNNSVLWGNSSAGTGKQLAGAGATINNSDYGNGANDVAGTAPTATASITKDPLFVDTAGKDFHLKSDSPALDAGDDTKCSETYDIRGTGFPRKLGKANGTPGIIDMGAYEYYFGTDAASNCVNPTSGGTIAAAQIICSGLTPAAFTSTTAASGQTGTVEYKWQWSATSASANDFADIASSNLTTYAPGALTASTWYKRLARVSCKSDWTDAPESNVIEITVNPLPTQYTVSGGGSYTSGGTGVSVTLSGSETGVNYQLIKGVTNTGTPVAGTGSSLNFGLQTAVGTYTVSATNSTTTCTQTMTGNAVVSITASAFNVTGGGNYCAGGNGVLIGLDGSLSGVKYLLHAGGGNDHSHDQSVNGTGSAISFGLVTQSGTYTVYSKTSSPTTYTLMSGSVVVTINPLPKVYSVTGGGSYCAGGTGVLAGLSDSDTGISYQLRMGGNNIGSPVAGTGNSISFGLQTAAGTYTVVAADNNTTCQKTMNGSATVTVNQIPAPTFTAQPGASTCAGTDVTYTTQSGKSSYVWGIPGTLNVDYKIISGSAGSASNTVTLEWLTPGSKTVTINYNAGGCIANSATPSTATTVNALPVVALIGGGAPSVCVNSTTPAFTDATSGGTWSTTSGTGSASITSGGVAAGITAGVVAAKYTVTSGGCSTVVTKSFTVNALPNAPQAISGVKEVCVGNTTTLRNGTTGGVWSSQSTAIATVSATGIVKGIKAGTTTIYYTVSNGNGCTNRVSALVTVNPLAAQPDYFTTYSSDVKRGRTNVVYTVPPVDGVTYTWSYSGRGATIVGTTNSVKVSFSLTATSGILSVTASNGCGTSQARTIAVMLNNNGSKSDTLVVVSPPVNPVELNLTREFKVYPNPSSGPAIFEFRIGENAKVKLDIFSMNGQLIERIYEGDIEAGIPQTALFEKSLPTGMYPCVLTWNGKRMTLKFVVTQP